MTVKRTQINSIISMPKTFNVIRNNMQVALRAYETCTMHLPKEKGYENYLRKFVIQYLNSHYPKLKSLHNEGARVYYNHNRYYRPDMFISSHKTNNSKSIKYRENGVDYLLSDIGEWGHDNAKSVRGCVNKPLTDFLKWFVLFDPSGKYKYTALPLCHLQIITDFSGNNTSNITQIEHIYKTLGYLVDKWVIDYSGHPAKAYIYLNFFDAGSTIKTVLAGKINKSYVNDLSKNHYKYYCQNKSWPLKKSIFNGLNALEAILKI